jgi:hypothetical protein
MGKEAKNPKEYSTLGVRRTVTPAKLAANRANAKLGGRPPGSMSCRVKDMRHVGILEDIAENSTNDGYRLTAIRDLFDRGHGRPRLDEIHLAWGMFHYGFSSEGLWVIAETDDPGPEDWG